MENFALKKSEEKEKSKNRGNGKKWELQIGSLMHLHELKKESSICKNSVFISKDPQSSNPSFVFYNDGSLLFYNPAKRINSREIKTEEDSMPILNDLSAVKANPKGLLLMVFSGSNGTF